jgi:hypothetical protein
MPLRGMGIDFAPPNAAPAAWVLILKIPNGVIEP